MTGRLWIVVGASGVGKDSVMRWVAAHTPKGIVVARRHITREQHASEDHIAVSEVEFASLVDRNAFALHWQAHGVHYGVTRDIDALLADGIDVLVNGSRAHLDAALARYPNASVVYVRAKPETIATRLAARGRETRSNVQERLARNDTLAQSPRIFGDRAIEIDNDGPLELAGRRLLDLLVREVEPRG